MSENNSCRAFDQLRGPVPTARSALRTCGPSCNKCAQFKRKPRLPTPQSFARKHSPQAQLHRACPAKRAPLQPRNSSAARIPRPPMTHSASDRLHGLIERLQSPLPFYESATTSLNKSSSFLSQTDQGKLQAPASKQSTPTSFSSFYC